LGKSNREVEGQQTIFYALGSFFPVSFVCLSIPSSSFDVEETLKMFGKEQQGSIEGQQTISYALGSFFPVSFVCLCNPPYSLGVEETIKMFGKEQQGSRGTADDFVSFGFILSCVNCLPL
jgi:hypothetical protein